MNPSIADTEAQIETLRKLRQEAANELREIDYALAVTRTNLIAMKNEQGRQ